ncbi:MAG: hypothetical protein B7733_01870 [Myxococcales bacterium FL481]|nr:MAG: hypothetical protein B7733_01870 [Myxococcales bacterium FL481]
MAARLHRPRATLGLLGALLGGLLSPLASCGSETQARQPREQDLPAPRVTLSAREGKLEHFPCQQCHDKIDSDGQPPPGPPKHPGLRFAHFQGVTNCYTCHHRSNRDQLTLLAGGTASFDESHRLCGQCHSEKRNDWEIGAHGKHVGGWRGERQRLACTDCHDPHAPARGTVTAAPGPDFPVFGIRKGDH